MQHPSEAAPPDRVLWGETATLREPAGGRARTRTQSEMVQQIVPETADSVPARIGFTVEWAIALQDRVRAVVRERLPELSARWPLQGIRFDAHEHQHQLILTIRSVAEPVVVAGPSRPLRAPPVMLPLPDAAEQFNDWAQRVRAGLELDAADVLAIVPFPAEAQREGFPRPDAQWDSWDETTRELWNAAVHSAFMQGLAALLTQTPAVDRERAPQTPVASEIYKTHPAFQPPDHLDQPLWRYMSVAKLLALLEQSAVFFSRADLLGDPWEGAYGRANEARTHELYGEQADVIRRGSNQARAARLTSTVFVSCWHAQGGESAAMWAIYAGTDPLRAEGVAIRSTFRRLLESLRGNDDVYAGKVRYQNYDTEFVPEDNDLVRFMRKRRSFEHEREIRAVIGRFEQSQEPGLAVPVALELLIEEIRLAPRAPAWLSATITSLLDRFQLEVPVRAAAMDDLPLT
jgi:hypothetical protein